MADYLTAYADEMEQLRAFDRALFGGAHFFYMNLTTPLVPSWLPPSQIFWGYATGIAHIAAGFAILTGR